MTFRTLLVALAATGLAAAAPAGAQDLISEFLGTPAGTCTCAVVSPPTDCGEVLAGPISQAREQQREVHRQCLTDWQTQCEAQYGWRQCASEEAMNQKAAQCDGLAQQWWDQIAAPQMTTARSQCNAANASWVQQCEAVTRPESCATCEQMLGEIQELEAKLNDDHAWIEARRSGDAVLTAEDDAEMAQKIQDVNIWERQLADKQSGYALLQDTDFCPLEDPNG